MDIRGSSDPDRDGERIHRQPRRFSEEDNGANRGGHSRCAPQPSATLRPLRPFDRAKAQEAARVEPAPRVVIPDSAPPIPRLDLRAMKHIEDIPGGVWPRARYRTSDGTQWDVIEAPGQICDEWVIAATLLQLEGAPAATYRHVERPDEKTSVAVQYMGQLDTSLDRLANPGLARGNGVYHYHLMDKLLGHDHVGVAIGIDWKSRLAVRYDMAGVMTHDRMGNRKPESDLGNIWLFGGDNSHAGQMTQAICQRMPKEFLQKGAINLRDEITNEHIEYVVDRFAVHSSAQERSALVKWLSGRRDRIIADVLLTLESADSTKAMKSSIDSAHPAIRYPVQAKWPVRATLEFLKEQFPHALFYVDVTGTRRTIAPRPGGRPVDRLGFEIDLDPGYVRVFDDLDEVGQMVLELRGPGGRGEADVPPGSPPYVVYLASEQTIIAAGDPNAPPAYIYAFVPDEHRSSFELDPQVRGMLRTRRSFEPLLVMEATPKDLVRDLYLMPEFADPSHPHHWERRLNGTAVSLPMLFDPSERPVVPAIHGIALEPLDGERLLRERRQQMASNAAIDRRHSFTPKNSVYQQAGAVVLEPDKSVWLSSEDDGESWQLPKLTVDFPHRRSEVALDAVNGQLGLHGPLLGFIDDCDDETGDARTRYFAMRRHAGAPSQHKAMLVTLEDALQRVRDPSDRAALRKLRAQLSPPSWHGQAIADLQQVAVPPLTDDAMRRWDLTHPRVQLVDSLSRISSNRKSARAPVVFRRTTFIDGREVGYTGRRVERYVSALGRPPIKVTSLEYERDGARPDEPTIIIQGGGPGASPGWYLGGGIGPIRVDERHGVVVDSPDSLISGARLLFVDSPGTGDSFTPGEHDAYFDIEGDAAITAEYVRQHFQDDRLADSPIFGTGTSYGVQRWARVIPALAEMGLRVGGGLLVSGAFSYQLVDFNPEQIASHACAIVSYAATARQHFDEMKRRYPDEAAFLKEVEDFAFGDYLHAIGQGAALAQANPRRFTEIAQKLAEYTHLDPDLIKRKQLTITPIEFCSELLPGQTIAALDGRMKTRKVPDDAGTDPFAYVLEEMVATYEAALTQYLREEVGYWPTDRPNRRYVVLDPLYKEWGWGPYQNSAARIQEMLVETVRRYPDLKWLVAGGKYDVRSPFMLHRYALNHLPADVGGKLTLKAYEGGHMFYATDDDARREFTRDVLAFMTA